MEWIKWRRKERKRIKVKKNHILKTKKEKDEHIKRGKEIIIWEKGLLKY